MKTVTGITIHAPASRIYSFAQATERWPQLLPHYDSVRVLCDDGVHRLVQMTARRGIFPITWTALQRNDPKTFGIYFLHVRGWTRGMEVFWTLEERDGATNVSIEHDVRFRFPVARRALERYVVTGYFIEGIASRTLSCMKSLAEKSTNA